jgi:hypothetical protein
MGVLQGLKTSIGRRFLKKEKTGKRRRKGSNFNLAQKVGLIYMDTDDANFKKIKDYVTFLHQNHGIRKVLALGYINADNKNVPSWQTHQLEYEYFTNNDLNWYNKPSMSNMLRSFVEEEFDILIDLTFKECIPLGFLASQSRAGMKVGLKGGFNEGLYDLIIDMDSDDLDKYLEQLDFYLSNFKIQ